MRILLAGFGSRGDVQPLVALGKALLKAGHQPTIGAGINFQSWIESEGLAFAPFRVDIEAHMQSDIGKEWLGNSSHNPMTEINNMRRMTESIAPSVAEDVVAMAEQSDVIISGVLVVDAFDVLARVFGKRHVVGLLSPFHPSRAGSVGMQALLPRQNTLLNRWWGYAIEAMLYIPLRGPSDKVRELVQQPPSSRASFIRAWNQTPTLLGVSPLVVPTPSDWPTHVKTTGYWFLDAQRWTPPDSLVEFLRAGEPPVYIGFGSMSNREPEVTTRIALDALRESGQRGILYSGWANLHAEDLPPTVYLLDSAPHEWLFPQMKAIIHHGGAGTTGAALRAGVPSMIVAHIGDQPYWGRRVHELGVGAAPLRRHGLSTSRLVEGIRQMVGDAGMRARAADLGQRIRSEDGLGNAVRILEEWLSA